MKPLSLLAACAVALALAACSTTPDKNAGAPVEGRDAVTRVDASNMSTGKLPAALTDPSSPLSKRSIYFALDSYDVSPDYSALVAAHARFLTENPSYKILIQGNTDERGSREYNLALGQKRADAVRRAMMLLGVKDSQIEAVSLGEEKPKAEGHDEAAWSENRRADILYPGEY
jgi:peptidoglycan-associated lipoprotein